ncbi:MAG: hypothetical protein KBC95_01155 [Candidatus Peribacteraceae bacterium]|nr:hypothetical protein [Candidatus Peribacteraceae bacterium]
MTDPLASLPWRFRGKLPAIGAGEHLLRRSRGHWIRYVLPIFVVILLSSAAAALLWSATSLAAAGSASAGWVLLLGLLVSLAVLHWFFHFLFSESVSEVFLTNKRILRFTRRLWLLDDVDETVLARIKVVEVVRYGFLQQLLDYGDLRFDTSDNRAISHIPHPRLWAADIEAQVR